MYGDGYVCDDNFNSVTADRVCTWLGSPYGVGSFVTEQNFPEKHTITMDELECASTATHVRDCSFLEKNDCLQGEGIKLVCKMRNILLFRFLETQGFLLS